MTHAGPFALRISPRLSASERRRSHAQLKCLGCDSGASTRVAVERLPGVIVERLRSWDGSMQAKLEGV